MVHCVWGAHKSTWNMLRLECKKEFELKKTFPEKLSLLHMRRSLHARLCPAEKRAELGEVDQVGL